jgi:long-chain acyl-CoA synthetase
MNYLSTDVD